MRSLGCYDPDITLGAKHHDPLRGQRPTLMRALACVQDGQENAIHTTFRRRHRGVPTLRDECHARREVHSKTPFKSGASRGNRSLWMGGVTGARVLLFPDKWGLVLRSLLFDFTVTNPLRLCWLDAARL